MLRKFEDTKEVIRSRKSKKERQHNGQKKRDNKWQTAIYKSTTNPAKNGAELKLCSIYSMR